MTDEVFKSRFHHQAHADELTHVLTQPTEDLILERNKELRNNEGAINDLGANSSEGTWGRQIASIPFIIYQKALQDGFKLNASDKELAGKEMHRFLATDIGKTCLVR